MTQFGTRISFPPAEAPENAVDGRVNRHHAQCCERILRECLDAIEG